MLHPPRPRDWTPTELTSDPTTLWARTRLAGLLHDQTPPPKYGSDAWCRLSYTDPRRTAAVIAAAELWRRFKEAPTPVPPAQRLPVKPHQLKATAGWPPIAVPGRPGWYRCVESTGRQVDRPRQMQGAA